MDFSNTFKKLINQKENQSNQFHLHTKVRKILKRNLLKRKPSHQQQQAALSI